MIWNNFLKMGVFWSISLRKQYISAKDSMWERFLDLIQSLRLDLAAIDAASRKAEVRLMGVTAHFGQFTAHIQTLKTQPNSKFSISLLRPKIDYYR